MTSVLRGRSVPNLDTVQAITNNLQKVLKGTGLNFSQETFRKEIPSGLFPFGEIFYTGEDLTYEFGQKPKYNEAKFDLRVTIKDTNPQFLLREMQRWVHRIRDGVTVNALNVNDLASSKLVSKVSSVDIDTTTGEDDLGIIEYELWVRYREL